MLINNIDTREYSATLLDRDISSPEIENILEWENHWVSPILFNQTFKFVTVTCLFSLETKKDDEAEKNISRLRSLSKSGEIIFEDLDFKYFGYLESFEKERIIQGKYELEVSWRCSLPYTKKIVNVINSNTTIHLSSTAVTPVRLEIESSEKFDELLINGLGEEIKIKNIEINDQYIIDSEEGLIEPRTKMADDEIDIWSFPYLSPGNNNITFNGDVSLKITYKPRWE